MEKYCNPLDLNYRFQVRGWTEECLREAADPSVVVYKNNYWLFPSKSGGYWRSDDLTSWAFIKTHSLPTEDYAPDVRVINDAIWFTASSSERCDVWRSNDPENDQWECLGNVISHVDPNFFQDDDGRVYLYGGCSNADPIWGVEIDPETLADKGERVALIEGHPDIHGWERFGEDNAGEGHPWMEGAWMTKHNGTYYLQYAAPGTEKNVYGDGAYTSDSPLGPFKYETTNPFSFKPGGFITGAGHGSTFEDLHGNWWHIATMRISVRHHFERRIGLFPAGFDQDGVLFCNMEFADYPTCIPQGKWNPITDAFADWMLLSYRKSVASSSALPEHPAANAVDEDIRSYWAGTTDGPEWLSVDLGDECYVHAMQVNFSEHGCDQYEDEGEPLWHAYQIEASCDGEQWQTIEDHTEKIEDLPHRYIELPEAVIARYLRLTILHMPGKGLPAVSGFRVFGKGKGCVPATVTGIQAKRNTDDLRVAKIEWEPVDNADGYQVYWGIAPEKLYLCWHVLEASSLVLNSLSTDVPVYYCAIESFNENGRSPKGEIIAIG